MLKNANNHGYIPSGRSELKIAYHVFVFQALSSSIVINQSLVFKYGEYKIFVLHIQFE